MKINKAILASYARHIFASVLAAATSVSAATGKVPTAWSDTDWMSLLNALWIAAIPVAIRYLNPNDPAFGKTKDATDAQ